MKIISISALVIAGCVQLHAQDTLKPDWRTKMHEMKTTPTLQVVVNAELRRGSKMHDQAFDALKKMECDYVRYCPWFPYPKLGVAELDAPKNGKTSWDFSLMDPLVEDLMAATGKHPVVMTFSTTPQWMWKSPWYSGVPKDPNTEEWGYNAGTELSDTTGQQVADYFKRVYQWYTQGGFTDEAGKKITSQHHFDFPYWEVLNEPDGEHYINGTLYNKLYDATVTEIRKVNPSTKFVGASLMRIRELTPDFMETFLDPKKHKAGIPLDYVSYHAYVFINQKRGVESEQYATFEQAKQFMDQFYFIDAMRKRLSPRTKTMINEVGTIRNDDSQNSHSEIEPWYWSMSAGLYAFMFGEMANMGVEVVGESQLVGYPGQFPCVTMVDWKTGAPNLRYWVLKLIRDNFAPGGKITSWSVGADNLSDYYARGFTNTTGQKKILLVNMRNKPLRLILPGARSMEFVSEKELAVQRGAIVKGQVDLERFGVAVVDLE